MKKPKTDHLHDPSQPPGLETAAIPTHTAPNTGAIYPFVWSLKHRRTLNAAPDTLGASPAAAATKGVARVLETQLCIHGRRSLLLPEGAQSSFARLCQGPGASVHPASKAWGWVTRTVVPSVGHPVLWGTTPRTPVVCGRHGSNQGRVTR